MTVEVPAEGLSLRAWRGSDADDLRAAFADPDIARWNPGPQGPDAAADFIRERNDWSSGSHVSWAVAEPGGRLLGSVSVWKIDPDQADAEAGYWVAPWARRRRVGTRSLGAAASYVFTERGLHRLYLYHAVDNLGSCGVAHAAGFSLEGTLRQSYRYADGNYHDEHLHARLRTDPAPPPPRE